MERQPITVSDAAVARIVHLLAERGEGAIGIRVGVRNAGCSGMAYTVGFATEKNDTDTVIEENGVTILIDQQAAMFLTGSEMDYVEDKLHSGFVFENPNEKGRCGCGESFYV